MSWANYNADTWYEIARCATCLRSDNGVMLRFAGIDLVDATLTSVWMKAAKKNSPQAGRHNLQGSLGMCSPRQTDPIPASTQHPSSHVSSLLAWSLHPQICTICRGTFENSSKHRNEEVVQPNIHQGTGSRPIIWEITPRMWTGWAFNGQAAWSCPSYSFGVVTSPSALEDHEVAPDAKYPVHLFVSML